MGEGRGGGEVRPAHSVQTHRGWLKHTLMKVLYREFQSFIFILEIKLQNGDFDILTTSHTMYISLTRMIIICNKN